MLAIPPLPRCFTRWFDAITPMHAPYLQQCLQSIYSTVLHFAETYTDVVILLSSPASSLSHIMPKFLHLNIFWSQSHIYVIMRAWVCVHMCAHAYCTDSAEAKKNRVSYHQELELWAAWCGCWEPNSERAGGTPSCSALSPAPAPLFRLLSISFVCTMYSFSFGGYLGFLLLRRSCLWNRSFRVSAEYLTTNEILDLKCGLPSY